MEKKRIIKRYDNKYFNKHKGHFIYTHTNNHNYIDFATLFFGCKGKDHCQCTTNCFYLGLEDSKTFTNTHAFSNI